MGITRTKKVIECDCGCDFGRNCGTKMTILFCYNRSMDTGTLYIDDMRVASFTDKQFAGLIAVITGEGQLDELTEDDLNKI